MAVKTLCFNALALMLLVCPARASETACDAIRASDVTRAFAQRATQIDAAAHGAQSATSHCQWRLEHLPSPGVTLTIDRYPSVEARDDAWRAALETYLHAGKMIQGLGAPAMWLPRKYALTGLLYVRTARAVCVITVPRSGARELKAAKVLAKLLVKRLI